mgnify:CR=1 FL=1
MLFRSVVGALALAGCTKNAEHLDHRGGAPLPKHSGSPSDHSDKPNDLPPPAQPSGNFPPATPRPEGPTSPTPKPTPPGFNPKPNSPPDPQPTKAMPDGTFNVVGVTCPDGSTSATLHPLRVTEAQGKAQFQRVDSANCTVNQDAAVGPDPSGHLTVTLKPATCDSTCLGTCPSGLFGSTSLAVSVVPIDNGFGLASGAALGAKAKALRREVHLVLRQVSYDYERMQYNKIGRAHV